MRISDSTQCFPWSTQKEVKVSSNGEQNNTDTGNVNNYFTEIDQVANAAQMPA